MQKDFGGWHTKKTSINGLESTRYFYEREIWWTAVGHNIGSEEDGKGRSYARPVLILRKFNRELFYGLPLSTAEKVGRYYHPVTVRDRSNIVLLSHMRDYDARRLLDKIGVIGLSEYEVIQKKLAEIITLSTK